MSLRQSFRNIISFGIKLCTLLRVKQTGILSVSDRDYACLFFNETDNLMDIIDEDPFFMKKYLRLEWSL